MAIWGRKRRADKIPAGNHRPPRIFPWRLADSRQYGNVNGVTHRGRGFAEYPVATTGARLPSTNKSMCSSAIVRLNSWAWIANREDLAGLQAGLAQLLGELLQVRLVVLAVLFIRRKWRRGTGRPRLPRRESTLVRHRGHGPGWCRIWRKRDRVLQAVVHRHADAGDKAARSGPPHRRGMLATAGSARRHDASGHPRGNHQPPQQQHHARVNGTTVAWIEIA